MRLESVKTKACSFVPLLTPSLPPPMMLFRSHLLLLASAAAINLSQIGTALANRDVIPLKSDWLFLKGDADIAVSSATWEKITIPHTWNALDGEEGPTAVTDKIETAATAVAATDARKAAKKETQDPHLKKGYYRGACWYERSLDIPAEWKGKRRVFIRFEAASTVAKTYINKVALGEHRGAFTAFCYEITDYLNYGGANQLRVQVDNTHREDLPPLAGDFNLFGGLYRDVELIVTDDVCISPIDYASSGVYLTTKSLDDKKATVQVRSIISNGNHPAKKIKESAKTPGLMENVDSSGSSTNTSFVVETEVNDETGVTVTKVSTPQQIPLEQTAPVTQMLMINDPHRWNGRKDPYLYTATVSVISEGKIVDQVSQPLGLRTTAISQEQGFLLNGQPYAVNGVCRHQDVRGKGWAISPEDEERDAGMMKEMGVTAVRNAHYPQSEHWHQINDKAGVLLWDEVSLVNTTRSTRAFWMNSEEQLRELIHQLYNHPSIVWWGIFNELELDPMPPCRPELAHMQEVAKEIDPNRIVVAASCRPHRYINLITDQIGLNKYPGWYDKENQPDMEGPIDDFNNEVGKRIAVSEYGAGGNISHHTEGSLVKPEPKGPFHPEEWQAFVHEQDWAQMKENPKLWGSFVWNMFDFACKRRDEGNTPSLNDKGLVTHDRQFKKDAFYFYKANWNPAPMVYISSRRAVNRTLPTTEVKVYSNCPEVELTLNGKSLGRVQPGPTKIALWPKVELTPGENKLEVTAISGTPGSHPVHDSCTWNLTSAVKP